MTDHNEALRNLGHALFCLPEDAPDQGRASFLASARALLRGIEDPGEALKSALASRNADLLDAVFKAWPETKWTRVHFQSGAAKIGTLAGEMRIDLLRLCRNAGLYINDNIHHLVASALRADNADALRFLREECGYTAPFWKPKDIASGLILCGPNAAPFLWEEFQGHLDTPHGQAMQSFLQFGATRAYLKEIAALLASGRDVTRYFRQDLDLLNPHVAALVQKTASNHGQLALKSLESDPIAVIGRPFEAEFYGISGKSFHQDYPPKAAQ